MTRSYRNKDVVQLATLSMGVCYAPDCLEPIARPLADGSIDTNYQIAHIVAIDPNGPRGDDPLPVEQRNEFANLLLLCKYHHNLVDRYAPANYEVAELRKWKRERESSSRAEYAGLRNVTEEKLRSMLDEVIESRDSLIRESAEAVAQEFPQIAKMIQEMNDSLRQYQSTPVIPSMDAIELLADAANQLDRLGPSYPDSLREAAELLTGRGGQQSPASQLASAAEMLDAVLDMRLQELDQRLARLEDLQ